MHKTGFAQPRYHTFGSDGRDGTASARHRPTEGALSPPASPPASPPKSPLPVGQLVVLALISLAEQTALNSISPYLPQMALSFPEVEPQTVGVYVGLIASVYALAQCVSGYFWGILSDRIGRKRVMAIGIASTAVCFALFGFCSSLWPAVAVQAAMGLLNGNSAIMTSCLGDLTDRSNQAAAFAYLPVVYGIGAVTGPAVGGLLVRQSDDPPSGLFGRRPFLAPNLFSVAILVAELAVCVFAFDETLGRPKPELASLSSSSSLASSAASASPPASFKATDQPDPSGSHPSTLSPSTPTEQGQIDGVVDEDVGRRRPSRDTSLILATYLLFSFCNVAYASIFPIFAAAAEPLGRDLSPNQIGLLLSSAGAATLAFQAVLYNRLRERFGNRMSYRFCQAVVALAFVITPLVGYKPDGASDGVVGKLSVWLQMGSVLIVRTAASGAGLSSALLLITNCAGDAAVLGRLNGLALALSAAGRAVAPLVAGSLFSVAVNQPGLGDLLPFGFLAAVSMGGFLLSIRITDPFLEDRDWVNRNKLAEPGLLEEEDEDVDRV